MMAEMAEVGDMLSIDYQERGIEWFLVVDFDRNQQSLGLCLTKIVNKRATLYGLGRAGELYCGTALPDTAAKALAAFALTGRVPSGDSPSN